MEIVLIALLILLATLVIGVAVPFAFGAATVFLVYAGGYSPDTLIPVGYSKMNTVVLLAIPLFILSGGLMEKGRIADPLVGIAETVFGRLRGGLGVAAVICQRRIRRHLGQCGGHAVVHRHGAVSQTGRTRLSRWP